MDTQQVINFAASSSSSSSSSMVKKYDVFLSFRGEDTRDNFTSHLYDALQKEVETYIDYKLEKGDGISQALIEAIQDSLVSVVIFSENYASSKWCLDEISMILECKKDHGQVVIPVFYKVDPSHVRKQTGSYKEAFAKHERDLQGHGDDKLHKWRNALTDAANLAGFHSQNYRNESEFIKDIVKDVLQKLNIRSPIELKGVVGIEESYAEVESFLQIGSTEVRVIGIWGMGGVGKTTLARALHAKLSIQFEGDCFLESVREQSEKNGLNALRDRLYSKLLGEKISGVMSHAVTRGLKRKKVLIILDDVATPGQLDYLISDYDCLAPGSRVIVTTRDKHILSMVNGIYQVKELNAHASLHLFSLNAFAEKKPKIGYEELSDSVIAYCKGNPLALKVLGARLRLRSIQAWISELRKLHKIPNVNIHNVLKLSFDDLDSTEKKIFLHIACFFKGEYRKRVLDHCGSFAAGAIEVLVDKSLITISKSDTIEMHDLIQEMGHNVVRQKSEEVLGRQSHLWDPEDVCDVLENNKGTEAVVCIDLDVSKINVLPSLSFDSFIKMTEVRFLKFYSSKSWSEGCKIYLPNGLKSLPDKLQHLEWHGYCLKSLPSTFRAVKLVHLDMRHSNLEKLWDGVQNLANLKEMRLSFSKDLVEVPDLSMATNLEILSLDECKNLREVHPSILSLHKLWYLNLKGCTTIESLETEVHLKSLQRLFLNNCSSLKKFSVSSEKLSVLLLEGTNIQELPTSIWRCEKLWNLSLNGCYNLESFGSKSSHDPKMVFLEYLDLSGCKLVNESNLCLILDGMRSLTDLTLKDCCNLRALPDSIGTLTSLKFLRLSRSINVEMLSPNIKNLLNLRQLQLDNCRKLMSLPELPPSLQLLSAINCTSLQTDITQLAFNMNSLMEVGLRSSLYLDRYVILPGTRVPDMLSFRAEGDSITFLHLPQVHAISGFICCLILPHLQLGCDGRGSVNFRISKHSSRTSRNYIVTRFRRVKNFISDHMLLFYLDIKDWIIWQKSRACDLNYSISFELCLDNGAGRMSKELGIIKRCGVCPVYASEQQQKSFVDDGGGGDDDDDEGRMLKELGIIKRCGVCPVYASEQQQKSFVDDDGGGDDDDDDEFQPTSFVDDDGGGDDEFQPTSFVFGGQGSTHNNEDDQTKNMQQVIVPQTITTGRSNLFAMSNELVKFNGHNYVDWSEQIKLQLCIMDMDLAIVIDEMPATITETSTEDDKSLYLAWERSNRLCLNLMRLTMAENVKPTMPKTHDANNFIVEIKKYSQSDVTKKSIVSNLMSDLMTERFDESQFIHDHPTSMSNMEAKRKSVVSTKREPKRKAHSFKEEESSRPEKHTIPFHTPSTASTINLNQTIEVSERKDLPTDNQMDSISDLVIRFEKSANVKANLEIISSNDEIKQQFHHVLEQL